MKDQRQTKKLKPVGTALRCEYLVDPLAVDAENPRLSWEMESPATGAAQTAYRLIAADSREMLKRNDGNLWDSGKVESSQSLHVHYQGKTLESCQPVFWKVKIWDERGVAGRWSKVATFNMGLLESRDWQAEWIGNYLGNTQASPLLRREFKITKAVKRALFYATACGIYHLTLDGRNVSDDLFAPGWTDYEKRRYYRCYDITRPLKSRDQHCLGVELGDGWYREWYGCWAKEAKRYGSQVFFLGQLRIEYEDGMVETIATDATWKSIPGPTRRSSFYHGESVDAQLEPRGWDRPGFTDYNWQDAVSRKMRDDLLLQAYPAEPVRITEELKPVKFWNVAPDVLGGKGGAAWGDAGVVCPWTLYQCYEDRDLLQKMYPAMKSWVKYLHKTSTRLLRQSTQCFGDWLSVGSNTPKEVIRTAHFAFATDIVRKAAEALGNRADATRYAELFADIKAAFNLAYVKPDGKIEGDTQTAYLMALKFGLLDGERAEQAAQHLVADIRGRDNHISTGFIGTAMIMSVLRDTGNLDIAYQLLENTTFPSWGYSVVNGATTIWERWNGWTKENGPGDVNMNSYSHYAYGAVVEWMFDTIAGIDHGTCGFQHFRLRPQPGGSLTHAAATYHSPYGMIRSAWCRQGKKMHYEVTVPANTRGTIIPPVSDVADVSLNGRRLTDQGLSLHDDGRFILPAGTYSMIWTA